MQGFPLSLSQHTVENEGLPSTIPFKVMDLIEICSLKMGGGRGVGYIKLILFPHFQFQVFYFYFSLERNAFVCALWTT